MRIAIWGGKSWGLTGLLILGVAAGTVRCYCLPLPMLHIDEGYSWRLTQYTPMELIEHTAADVHPPLYYLLLKCWISACGSSPAMLRGLSILFGVCSVLVMYLLCVEALRGLGNKALFPIGAVRRGATLSALLVALHASQVSPGRTARMYSLGILLAGVTAWLLLRALRATNWRLGWWSIYGMVTALFLYTHYYAAFTIVAQILFAACDCVWRWRGGSPQEAAAGTRGLMIGATLAVLCYAPWVPVVWSQTAAVREYYGIQPLTIHQLESMYCSWSMGPILLDVNSTRVLEGSIALGVAALLFWGGRAAWFFALQAAMPWGLSLLWSEATDRSIVVERYLVFAQFAFLGLASVLWVRLTNLPVQLLSSYLLLAICAAGTVGFLRGLPDSPPAIVEASRLLTAQSYPTDLVWVPDPPSLITLQYYASQANGPSLAIRCPGSTALRHVTHASALKERDMVWDITQIDEQVAERLWVAMEGERLNRIPALPLRKVFVKTFTGGGRTSYTIGLFQRSRAPLGGRPPSVIPVAHRPRAPQADDEWVCRFCRAFLFAPGAAK